MKKFIDVGPAIQIMSLAVIPTTVSLFYTSQILGREKIVMLDHDDLYSEILRNHGNQEEFIKYLENLAAFCDKYNVILLRTIGVLFADSEKRISEYVK